VWPTASPPTSSAVAAHFGIDLGELRPAQGGFESDGFTDGTWFIKLFRFEPETDATLALTGELAGRGLPVPAAVRAVDGTYTGEHDGKRYAVHPFVAGREGTWVDSDAIARSMRALHEIADLDVPSPPIEEWCVDEVRDRRDHPWLADRRDEVTVYVDRLEAVIDRANATDVPMVVCHHDLLPHNTLFDETGQVAALLDWGYTWMAPREHDLFSAFDAPDPVAFLESYGASDLDATHLEYALLARAVRDLAARVVNEHDRPGVDTWGFDRWRRLDADLELVAPFLA
jgi:Ser/Thr protein kinase RdoA (MazF antagonist)